MKIAIFADPYLDVSGGIASSVEAQKTELKKLGHEVKIFCPGQTSQDPDVVIVPTSARLRFGGSWLARWPEIVMEWIEKNYPDFADFDIVHTHYEAGCSLAGMLLARKYKIPLVQTMHGREDVAIASNIPKPAQWPVAQTLNSIHSRYIPNKIQIPVDDYLATTRARAAMWTLMVNHANFADLVVVPSQHFTEKLQHYGVDRPTLVMSNGIVDEIFEQFPAQPRQWDGERPLEIIWNSRVSREKRILPFLQALTKVQGDFRLHVYGEGNDLEVAREFVHEHGLDKKIKIHGRTAREKIWQQLKKSDLSVMNSYGFDNQPMVLLEAEVAGVPTIFCDADMQEIGPREGSIFVNGPEVGRMAAALNDLFARSERIEEMSQAMLKHREELRQSKLIKKLVREYKKLV